LLLAHFHPEARDTVADLIKRFRRRYVYPLFRSLFPHRLATFGTIKVQFKKHIDGGGSWSGQGFIPFLQSFGMPKAAARVRVVCGTRLHRIFHARG
jgi:hypothetical protein